MYFGYPIKPFGDGGFTCEVYKKGKWYNAYNEPTDKADSCITIYEGNDIVFQSTDYGLSEKWLKVAINHFINKEELDKKPKDRIAYIRLEDGTLKYVRGTKDYGNSKGNKIKAKEIS